MLTIKVKNSKAITNKVTQIKERLADPNRTLWKLLGILFGRMTTMQFKASGGLYGQDKWKPISPSMNGKIRYGTDLKGMSPPRKPGANVRRFTSASKPLMASGGYMKSFVVQETSAKGLLFGSRYKKAADIQGDRMILPVWEDSKVQQEVKTVIDQFIKWVTGANR